MVPMSLEFVNALWVPNIFIYNLKTYKLLNVLSKLAGLWIDTEKKVLYRQANLNIDTLKVATISLLSISSC